MIKVELKTEVCPSHSLRIAQVRCDGRVEAQSSALVGAASDELIVSRAVESYRRMRRRVRGPYDRSSSPLQVWGAP